MAKATEPAALSDQLRAAIVGSGLSVYAVAKGSGVAHPIILRFLSKERTLQLATADKLAAFLGMELTPPRTFETGAEQSGAKQSGRNTQRKGESRR